MGEVYGNASVTIAASGAESVHDGLFKSNNSSQPSCSIPFELPNGEYWRGLRVFRDSGPRSKLKL
jgi:hypothetical protein